MMPQPPHHKEEQPRGLPDETVDAAHEFLEHAEEDMEEAQKRASISSSEGGQDESLLSKATEAAKEKLNMKKTK
ncbi:uncharacterized protein DNG_04122 [Cephalotrichum gorgonifer]|uniref:Uncharacterized protein n=1 Tax=Cephalotrichum gorgonifer TaxID=2041049 RepID=A0AAE8MY50_9PEZI|nr:uncharacterized protein DNG_04122 [Cephalotrichum gorgonifer]